MNNLLTNGLLAAGAYFLIRSLSPASLLIRHLPPGSVRNYWYVVTGLIALLIVGYMGYVVMFWGRHDDWLALMISGIFFFGACLIWLVVKLALQTVVEIRRVGLLDKENITDPLLGIYNRTYLDRRLVEEFARARRYEVSLSLLFLDIDHFKQINAVYGQQAGDRALSHLAELILSSIRAADVVARYGEEQLAIIATDTADFSAIALAERLYRHIETHPLTLRDGEPPRQEIRFTASIGVAALGPEVSDLPQLVSNAEAALYQAKKAGHNRVVLYQEYSVTPAKKTPVPLSVGSVGIYP